MKCKLYNLSSLYYAGFYAVSNISSTLQGDDTSYVITQSVLA